MDYLGVRKFTDISLHKLVGASAAQTEDWAKLEH